MAEQNLVSALTELVRRGSDEFTVPAILHELCLVAAGGLGVDGAGVMQVDDVSAANRWPELVGRAARAGLGSMPAVPLLARERSWGVLDVQRSRARPWSTQDLLPAGLFADVAASFIAMAAEGAADPGPADPA